VIAWAHAIGLQAMIRAGVLDAAVVAVHDLDDERAAGFAAVNGAAVVPGVAEVLESCDAVWVCTPTSAHRAVVEAAAARGLPVFCEKPLAPDLAGAEALAATVAGAGVPAQVGLVLRSAPVFRALRDVLASGELGAPMTAIFRDDQYFPVQGLYGSTWRGDVEVAGGGCLIEHSIHDLDILRFCLGEVTEVTGRTANFSGHEGGPGDGVSAVRVGRLCRARERVARHLEPGLDPAGRGVLPSGDGLARRRLSRTAARPDQRRHRGPALPATGLGARPGTR